MGQKTRLVGEATVTAHRTQANRDVVTNLRVMADLRGVNGCASADDSPMADLAGAMESGIVEDARPGEDHAVGIVDPALSLLAESAFLLHPAAFAARFDVSEIDKRHDLAQGDALFAILCLVTILPGLFAETVFTHSRSSLLMVNINIAKIAVARGIRFL